MTDLPTHAGQTERTVFRTGGSRGVRLRRRYDTSPRDVWDAWTSPDRLRRWLGEVTGDASEGGVVTLDMGAEESATCTIIRCDPPHRLVASWSDAEVDNTAVQLTLRPDDGTTILDLEHVGFPDSPLSRIFGEGWEDFLNRLGEHVAGTTVHSPSWDEVRTALDPHWNPLADDPAHENHWPTVTADGERAILNAQSTYPAPQGDVWAALTDPKQLATWFADVELSGGGSGDGHRGASWRAVFRNGGASGTIRECMAERTIVTTWQWDHEDIASVLHVTLEPAGDGTLVRIEQRDTSADYPAGYAAGWYAMLACLSIQLGGREPTETDWDADFAFALRTLG